MKLNDEITATGTITKVTNRGVRVDASHPMATHSEFFHGAINNVPEHLRKVGLRVTLAYRVTNRYGLWFITGENHEA